MITDFGALFKFLASQSQFNHIEFMFEKMLDWFWGFFPKLITAILVFIIGWWLSKVLCRFIKRALTKSKADQTAVSFIYSVTLFTLRVFFIISAIAQLGVNVTALLTALGAATVTVGLALQDTIKNVASGIMIIINKPFRAGEYIEFEGLEGTVQKILITNTYLLTIDNKEIIIPNSRLTNNSIVNYTAQKTRRLDLKYNISYSDNMQTAKNIILNIVNEDKRSLKDPEPLVAVSGLNDSSVEIALRVWCSTEDYWSLYFDLQEQIKLAFDREKINIPYNQLDVHIKSD